MSNASSDRKPVIHLPIFDLLVGQSLTITQFESLHDKSATGARHYLTRAEATNLVQQAYEFTKDFVAYQVRTRNGKKSLILNFPKQPSAVDKKVGPMSLAEFIQTLGADLTSKENQAVFGLGNLVAALNPEHKKLTVGHHILYLNEHRDRVSGLILSINFTAPVFTSTDLSIMLEHPNGGGNVVSMRKLADQ